MGQVIGFKQGLTGPMESGRVMPHQIEIGMHLFRVVAPGGKLPWVDEIRVKTRPSVTGSNGEQAFTGCAVRDGKVQRFENYVSLRDIGVIINGYNMSLTFHKREDAEAYRDRLMRQEFTVFEHTRWTKVIKRNLDKFLNGKSTK
uniref:Uncharacterized protein n=1 Tax=Pseudomonas phage HRDY3 TaxID=3236930 RepID=A0AB39CE98_9VIRU